MRAKRELGQHFLVSGAVVDAIVRACAAQAGVAAAILEVGPGRGALTGGLAALDRPFFAIEKDYDLVAGLSERFPGLSVALGDALELDLPHIAAETRLTPWLVVGNLPYNAGTEILRRVLSAPETCSACLVMLQREVAQKFCGGVGDEGYGSLSVWTAAWWARDVLFSVPAGAFQPPPKITSAVCRFLPHPRPGLAPQESRRYWAFVRRAFAQPRKTLAANLAAGGGSKAEWAGRLERGGASGTARPAQVPPALFERLYLGGTFSNMPP